MLAPRLLELPVVGVSPIANHEANRLLVAWGHKLGPCNRPFRTQSWALEVDGEPVAVAMTCSIVNGPVAGYGRGEVVELARLASSNNWANRVMLRLWREVLAHRWGLWPVKAAVSYSHNALHGGNSYRTDGWRKVSDKCGTTGKGGNWGRRGSGYQNQALHGFKSLWVWEYPEVAP